ncbi:MAG: GtrA family protein [Acidimicrobiia bacterium]|nr:GtrA family protein [Acidimicrobiia bacterium]
MPGDVATLLDRPIVAKLLRYAATSVVGVVVGQSFLYLFDSVLGWEEWLANVGAVAVSSVPAYLISRYWVWQVRDKNSLKRELVPFWGMALLGLALSTILVSIVSRRTEAALAIGLANLAGFGVLWVAKFFVLDRVLFARPEPDPAPPPLL